MRERIPAGAGFRAFLTRGIPVVHSACTVHPVHSVHAVHPAFAAQRFRGCANREKAKKGCIFAAIVLFHTEHHSRLDYLMRIRHIAVRNLFGMFDHDIPLNGGDRITIVYGPNGYGKTFTLTLVDELFNPGFEDFYRIPFSELAVGFDDGSTIGLTKEERNDGETLTFTLTPAAGRKKTFTCGGRPCRGGDEPAWFRCLRVSVHIRFVHTDRLVRFQRSGKSHNGLAVHDMADSLTASV
jgi:hypothetical protein